MPQVSGCAIAELAALEHAAISAESCSYRNLTCALPKRYPLLAVPPRVASSHS